MHILVTGGTGQVGTELSRLEWPAAVRLHCPSRSELNLADPPSVTAQLKAKSWDAILSCGAYTAVDKAERDSTTAWLVNAVAPATLAAGSAELGIPIVHVSTDYVFSGDKEGWYIENDPVGPINTYGASKEGGEQAVRTGNPRHAIVRSSWVVSANGANFIKTVLRLAREREELRVVADQHGCPTSATDLAAALQAITLGFLFGSDASYGTYHYANGGETNWAELAAEVFSNSQALGGPSAKVTAIASADHPTPARRPANSRLDTSKLRDTFGLEIRPWQRAVQEIVQTVI
ncbi:dTDP-4-dehydrorhamnose reductase [Micromonospora sp. STR1s_5]|nr:dTDP-4-dehydrorhamnose reductase [Micromonospora sp. STR1s_5]